VGKRREPEVVKFVVMPLALAAGIALAVSVGVLSAGSALAVWRGWSVKVPLAAAAFSLGLTFSVAALALLRQSNEFLYLLERATRVDIDRDGVVGRPEREPESERPPDPPLIYVHGGARPHRAVEEAADFRYWLKKVYQGRGAGWRDWKGETLPSGSRISQDQWSEWCQRLIDAELAERPYETAPLDLSGSTLLDALVSFRDLWPPAPQGGVG